MDTTQYNTLLVASSNENFAQVFLVEKRWYGVRIGQRRLSNLKWIALYRRSPVSAITHYAAIVEAREDPATGRYRISVDQVVELARPVPMRGDRCTPIQGQRYVQLKSILEAREVADLLGPPGRLQP
jgi:hypothetical protein